MKPSPAIGNLISRLRAKSDQHRHLKTSIKTPKLESPLPGVFTAGCVQMPMDIHDTIAQAHEAADQALSVLKQAQGVHK
jgi:heterodisulfide reductase subunit A-like polyferredoxin